MKNGKTPLFYVAHGRGKRDILFLHGLNTDLTIWKNVLPRISSKYKSWALQMPQYGSNRLQHYAHLIKKFIQHHGIRRPILVGQSLGAYLILILLKDGLNAQKVILITPPLIPRASTLKNFVKRISRYILHHPIFQKHVHLFLDSIPSAHEFLKLAPLRSYVQCIYDVLRKPFRMPKVLQPTLLIYGKKDPLINLYHYEPYEDPKLMTKNIFRPHAVIALEKASHYIPDQRPRTLAKIINQFLD